MTNATEQTKNFLLGLTADKVTRTYRGREGCMCGCRGTYRETELAAKRMIRDLLVALDEGASVEMINGSSEQIVYLDRYGRTTALYASL